MHICQKMLKFYQKSAHHMTDFFKVNKKIKAHHEVGDANSLQSFLPWNQLLFSLDLNYNIKIWNQSLHEIKEVRLDGQYHLCMKKDQNNLLVGQGNGVILFYDEQFKLKNQIKVTQDAISDILINENTYIVISHDGLLVEVDKNSQQKIKWVDLQFPLTQILQHQNYYYIAGVSSWKVSKDFRQVQQIQRASYFLIFKNQVFGIQQNKKLYCYSKNQSYNELCEMLHALDNNRLLAVFQNQIKVLTFAGSQISQSRKQKTDLIQIAYTTKAIWNNNKNIYTLGSENGSFLQIELLI